MFASSVMQSMKHRFFCFFVCLLTLHAAAQPRLARLFSDHAVLQRQKTMVVWGWANPNERIEVSFARQTQFTNANVVGRWQVKFLPMEAGGPYKMTVTAASGKVEVNDLMVGDVWLCSGQSNMEWTVAQSNNYATERKNADFPQIRHFRVEHEVSLQPEAELKSGAWEICTSDNVGRFTAVGFFFAREVFRETGVPIGLLHSSWGGSQVESWISKEAMLGSDELREYGQNLPTTWEAADLHLEKLIKKKLLGSADAQPSLEDEKKYLQADFDCTNWLSADPMGQWDWKGIWAWRGNGYMAKMVDIPADMAGQITTLGLAENFSFNEIYVNGRLVAAGLQKGPRKILVPANTWKPGTNKLLVKMNNAIDPSWYGLGLMGSGEDLFVSTPDQKISLAGGDWKLMPAFAEPHHYVHSSNNMGTAIYNAMIAPLVPFALRGALWYQGESNALRAVQYRKTFPLMIEDWRKRWNDEFPFYFVQLSSYGRYQNSNEGSPWAELREAQTMALRLPQTGMAVTIDIGNPKDIHPTNKQDVGKRLAAHALKSVYGKNIIPSGPLYESVKFEKGQAILSFQHIGGGLMVRDKYGYLKGFEMAGADGVFHYAQAEIVGNKVVVRHPLIPMPTAVRYAWADAPEDANLFNAEGLPASPFRTDAREPITGKVKFE